MLKDLKYARTSDFRRVYEKPTGKLIDKNLKKSLELNNFKSSDSQRIKSSNPIIAKSENYQMNMIKSALNPNE